VIGAPRSGVRAYLVLRSLWEWGTMPRAGLEYERPSRLSQALIAGFSLGVVAMTGWLVLMIMFSHDASTMTAEGAGTAAAPASPAPPQGPPRVENPTPGKPFRVTPASTMPPSQTSPWGDGRSLAALPSAPLGGSYTPGPSSAPNAAPPPSAYATPSPASPRIDYRTAPSEFALPEAQPETEVVPLPQPRPRRVATIPVPRPRPHLDEDDAPQPPAEKSLFDLLINRQH
jgi:hypothetical protein